MDHAAGISHAGIVYEMLASINEKRGTRFTGPGGSVFQELPDAFFIVLEARNEIRGARNGIQRQKFQGSRDTGLIQNKYVSTRFDSVTMPVDLPLR